MDKIEVGEYVRTKDGVIFKILTKDKSDFGNHYYGITDNENYSNYTYGKGSHNDIKNKILKHSFNIINLIEIGDIVNGYRIDERAEYDVLIHKARGINRSGFIIPVAQYNEDIKTILTKEQMEANQYVV